MPPAGEMVNPKPLSGQELQRIILADVQDVMQKHCMLNGVSAFGQVSYELTIKMHFQNLTVPSTDLKIVSRPAHEDDIAADPARANVQGEPPLEIEDGETVAVERTREIEAPNQARVEFELPVPIVKRGSTGRPEEVTTQYPKHSAPPTKATTRDITEDTKAEFAERKRKRKK